MVFVSFRETLEALAQQLRRSDISIIRGGQSQTERDEQIDLFQSNKHRVCLCMIQAGGVGVSLHDTTGTHPRVSLLTPAYNATELKQALGRIHRAGGKTPVLQKIVFVAGTIEESACRAVKKKLENIQLLNDGDLGAGIMEQGELL